MKQVQWKKSDGTVVLVRIKSRIAYSDVAAIAIAVRNDVFRNGTYRPYMKEVGIWHYVLLNYTDLLIEDTNELMKEIEYGTLKRLLMRYINKKQFAQIRNFADELVNHECRVTGLDALCKLLITDIVKQAKEQTKAAVSEDAVMAQA